MKKGYSATKIDIFKEYGDLIWERVKNLPRGFCHGDLHRGNLLKTSGGEYFVLDFDTSCSAFSTYDIMVMCDSTDYFAFESNGYNTSKNIYESFLVGYSKYHTLSQNEINAFYDFIAIRHFQLQANIMEIYGLDCVDEEFLDNQLDWLKKWILQCDEKR